jgi:hypothetical protein
MSSELWVQYERSTTGQWETEVDLSATGLEIPLDERNVGYQLLLKMGWKKAGLGKREDGRVDPIPLFFREKTDFLGVGKHEEYHTYSELATEHRRALETEKEETEELVKKRQEMASKNQQVKEIVSKMVRPFYCELCDKQYKNIAEYDKHLNSYDHNHKARFMETKKMMKKIPKSNRKKDELKEQKRLEKIVAAAGVSIETPQKIPSEITSPKVEEIFREMKRRRKREEEKEKEKKRKEIVNIFSYIILEKG